MSKIGRYGNLSTQSPKGNAAKLYLQSNYMAFSMKSIQWWSGTVCNLIPFFIRLMDVTVEEREPNYGISPKK